MDGEHPTPFVFFENTSYLSGEQVRGWFFLDLFSSAHSHLFLSLIGARTLKMPIPYSPPNVESYTPTPSHQLLLFGHGGTDHLPTLAQPEKIGEKNFWTR